MRAGALWTLIALAPLLGCDPLLNEARDGGLADAGDPTPADVAGVWTITGSGQRTHCIDERFNAERFEVASIPLEIAQDGAALRHVDNVADQSFEFEATPVVGGRVRFTTLEQTQYGPIQFDYDGQLNEVGNLRGSFVGTGPSDCDSTGHFVVEIR